MSLKRLDLTQEFKKLPLNKFYELIVLLGLISSSKKNVCKV